MNRAAIVAEARTWIDTPFQHQQHLKGIACDCGGLLRGVAINCGIIPPSFLESVKDQLAYPFRPNGALQRACAEFFDPVPFKDSMPGDLLLFRIQRQPQHMGIITQTEPLRMVHSSNLRKLMRVVEQDVTSYWRTRVQACYRYRGIV